MKSSLLLGATAFLLTSANLFAVESQPASEATSEEDDNGYQQIAIFAKALELVRQDYVDGYRRTQFNSGCQA